MKPISFENKDTPIVDAEIIELKKALERYGASLSLPKDAKFISFEDRYIGLPLIAHKATALPTALRDTLAALQLLVTAWKAGGHYSVGSFGVSFPVQDREVRISVLGHMADLDRWLQNPLSTPPTSWDGILKWSEEVSAYLARQYSVANDSPSLFQTMTAAGVLSIERKPVDARQGQKEWSQQHRALTYKLVRQEGEKALSRALRGGEISIGVDILILESRCAKCGQPYQVCPCSRLLDEGVAQEVTSLRFAFPFWTDCQ